MNSISYVNVNNIIIYEFVRVNNINRMTCLWYVTDQWMDRPTEGPSDGPTDLKLTTCLMIISGPIGKGDLVWLKSRQFPFWPAIVSVLQELFYLVAEPLLSEPLLSEPLLSAVLNMVYVDNVFKDRRLEHEFGVCRRIDLILICLQTPKICYLLHIGWFGFTAYNGAPYTSER